MRMRYVNSHVLRIRTADPKHREFKNDLCYLKYLLWNKAYNAKSYITNVPQK
jgi:hypothetical protein